MRYAIIANGMVANIATADPAFAVAQGWVEAPDNIAAGWHYDGQAFSLPVIALADLKAAKFAAVDAKKDAILIAGYAPTHPHLAGELLQNRGIEDRRNWDLALSICNDAIAAGQGAVKRMPFRTAANHTILLTYSDAATVLRAFHLWDLAVLQRSWGLKDAVTAAADRAALAAIDIEAGWP